jgi:hypothetical protein
MRSAAPLRFALLALLKFAEAQCTDNLTAACCSATEAELNAKYEAHLAKLNADAGGELDMQTRHRCVLVPIAATTKNTAPSYMHRTA